MKYVVLLCDGMADMPVEALDGKTPMEAAEKPHMDSLAVYSEVGLCQTVPDGFSPGSDVANLSVMGFDPAECYTGRSPLEAAGIGVEMRETDIAFRCNLVTLSEEPDYEDRKMVDYSAGDISTEEARELIETLQAEFGNEQFRFHAGVAYRHCLIWNGGTADAGSFTPPHDMTGERVRNHLNRHPNAAALLDLMKRSAAVLENHPVNLRRKAAGKRPANSIWLWGMGTRPRLQSFEERFGLKGSVITAVDLLRGIGNCAKMNVPRVPGVTGYLDTNFAGKAEAAVLELENGADYVYVHVEAPDECGHRFETQNKVEAIRLIDERMMPVLLRGLSQFDDYKILIMPDHPTPLSVGTHTADPVPFLIFRRKNQVAGVRNFCERTAAQTGLRFDSGVALAEHFLDRKAVPAE